MWRFWKRFCLNVNLLTMLCMEGNIESAKEALSKFSLKTLLLSISRVSFSFPFKNVSYVHVFLSAGEFRGGRLWGKGLLSYHDGSPGTEGYFQARLEKYYKFSFISDKKNILIFSLSHISIKKTIYTISTIRFVCPFFSTIGVSLAVTL